MPTKAPKLDDVSDHGLRERRTALLLSIDDIPAGTDAQERTPLEQELSHVENELDARRRARERAEVVALAREQRARDGELAAREAQLDEARGQLLALADERATAAANVDRAVTDLAAAFHQWRAVGEAQRAPTRLLAIDVDTTSPTVLAIWLSHQLSELFYPAGSKRFDRWEHDDRDRPFVDVDQASARLVNAEEAHP